MMTKKFILVFLICSGLGSAHGREKISAENAAAMATAMSFESLYIVCDVNKNIELNVGFDCSRVKWRRNLIRDNWHLLSMGDYSELSNQVRQGLIDDLILK